jgi:hypothetical protein
VRSDSGIVDASQFAIPFSSRHFSLIFTVLYILLTVVITALQYVVTVVLLCRIYYLYSYVDSVTFTGQTLTQILTPSKYFVICGLKTIFSTHLAGMFIYTKHCLFVHITKTERYLVHIGALMPDTISHNNPSIALYMLTPLHSHRYAATCFSPQRAVLRQ